MKLLMVCLGNICRSPIAEGVMQELINRQNLGWTVDSSGTNGYHVGEAPHKYSQKICRQNGIDISRQRSIKFNKKDFDAYDYIFVMADDVYDDVKKLASKKSDLEKVNFFLNSLYPNENKIVPDPWYGNEDGYKPVFDLIMQGCEAIIEKLKPITAK